MYNYQKTKYAKKTLQWTYVTEAELQEFKAKNNEPLKYINTKNIVDLHGVCNETAQRILRKIRKKYRIQKRFPVRLEYYCRYYDLQPEAVQYSLNQLKPKKMT